MTQDLSILTLGMRYLPKGIMRFITYFWYATIMSELLFIFHLSTSSHYRLHLGCRTGSKSVHTGDFERVPRFCFHTPVVFKTPKRVTINECDYIPQNVGLTRQK